MEKHEGQPILEVKDLVTSFPVKSSVLRKTISEIQAVSKVSFRFILAKH